MNVPDFSRVRFPVWMRITLIALAAIVPLVVFLVIHSNEMFVHNRHDAERQIAVATEHTAEDVSDLIDRAVDLARAASSFRCVEAGNATETCLCFRRLVPYYEGILNLVAFDMKGNVVGSALSPETALRLNCATMPWFGPARSGRVVVSDIYVSKLSRKQAVIVAMPLLDETGRQVGVIGAVLDPRYLRGVLALNRGTTGNIEFALIDSKGNVIAATANSGETGEPYLTAPERGAILSMTSGALERGERGAFRFVRLVPGSDWRVVASLPLSSIDSAASSFRQSYFLAILVALLFSGALTYWVSAGLRGRIKTLAAAVAEFEKGNYSVRVELAGSDELAALGSAFNAMVEARARAEDELRQSERFVSSVLEGITEGLAVIDRDFNILSANSAYCFQVRMPYSEILSKKCYEVSHRSESPCWEAPGELSSACPVRLAFESGRTEKATHTHTDAEGRHVFVEVSAFPMKDESGNVVSVIELVQDVTDRVRLQQELLEAEKRYRTLYDEAPDMMYSVDSEGRIILFNDAFRRELGYEEGELFGKSLFDLVAPELKPTCTAKFEKLRAKGTYEGDLTLVAKDGRRIPVHVKSRAVYDSEGRFVMSDAIMRNLTEQKSLEAQVMQAQKMEAIGQLAGSLAHDFNNYLTAIIGYATLLKEKLAERNDENDELDVILSTAEKAASLTRALLDFSRRGSQRIERIDVNVLLAKQAQLVEKFAGDGVRVEYDLGAGDMDVLASENALSQILVNLVTNAHDAMPDGGVLRISTRSVALDADRVEKLGLEPADRYVCLQISDTGIGMDEKTKNRIFEPFFTTKSAGKGTGLGLAIVYTNVKNLGGFIEVDSKKGAGTVFRIYLPAAPDVVVADAAREERRDAIPVGDGETILVAEDDENIRRLIASVLKRNGYRVLACASGEEALEQFKNARKDVRLALLDIMMPGMSGVEALELMREIEPDLPAIFLTGYAGDSLFRSGFDSSVPVIEKPVVPDVLLKEVARALGKLEGDEEEGA